MGLPPNEPVWPPSEPLYPLVTNKLPEKSVSLDLSFREALLIKTYSVEKPVSLTFFKLAISPCTNPLTFSTLIVALLAEVIPEPDNTVEFATYNWPPTAFTVSFSNTAVDKVPRIVAFSNSAVPLPSESILHPFTPLAKSAVSNLPLECMTKFCDCIWSFVIVQPPMVFPSPPSFTNILESAVPLPS